jgi:hypothetical protein
MKELINRYATRSLCCISLLIAFSACDDEYEPIFNQSPDERVRAALNEYKVLLMDADHGWKATLYTGTGAGYFYYFDFSDNGNVTMLSDFNETTAGDIMESTWTLKALQRPTLSFTTYSYVHMPADPDGNINNGLPGSGLLSDFEFTFIRTTNDSVILKGTQHNSEIVFIRATAEETQAYYDKRIQTLLENTNHFLSLSKGYRFTLPDQTVVPMALSLDNKLISFQYLADDGETIQIPKTSFTFSVDGIILRNPITIHGYEINELVWDDVNHSYYVPLENGASLSGSDEPFLFYPATPLYESIGDELVTVTIPDGAGEHPLPGQSDSFTEAYNYAATQMHEGPYRLTLRQIELVFIPNTDRMIVAVTVTQGNAGFRAQYEYSYLFHPDGILKFRLEGMDQNGGALYTDMLSILSHFDNDTFKLEYVGGGFDVITGFFSQEEPGYYFSGYLKK